MRKILLSLAMLAALAPSANAQNYAATAGSGLTFGANLVGGVLYPQQNMCDATTPARCVVVDASGRITVLQGTSPWVVSNGGTFATQSAITAASGSIASGAVSSGAYASGAFASGSIASGALASGSIASGAMVDLLTMRQTVAAGTVASNSLLTGGIYNSTPITLTNGQGSAMQFDANGYLKVNTAAGAAAGGTSSNFGSAFPTPGTAVGMSDGTNMVAMRSTAYGTTPTGLNALAVNAFVTNSNANGQATMANSSPVVIASNQSAVPVTPGAQEVHLGEIGSNQIKVQVAQTVTASSAYTSGNAIGGKMTIAGAARVSGSLGAAGTGGILTGLMMNSKSVQTTQVDVFLFDADPSSSTCTDKTAFVLATADFDKVIGTLTIPSTAANGAGWFSGGTGSVGVPTYYPVTYDLSSATSIYACAVTRGTPTYTATSDVSFKFNILRN